MRIFDDCRVPRPFFWELGRVVAIGAAICGLSAVIAAIAAAALGSASVASAAVGAALVAAEVLIIGWGVTALFSRVFPKNCACT